MGCLGRARGVQRRDFPALPTARGVAADRRERESPFVCNGNTLVHEFAAIAPRDVSFEMFHQSSGFDLQTLGNGIQDGSLQSSNRSILLLLLLRLLIPRL